MYEQTLKSGFFRDVKFTASVFPTAEDRDFWENIPADIRAELTDGAEALPGTPWPQVLCSQALEFERSGDRAAMEGPHFEKRRRLAKLVAAECFEHKGRFLDDIINGLAFIAGEPFWGVSAHYPRPDATELKEGERQNYIDLFAAETASLIARTLHLLKKDLTRECAELVFYLETELERRIKSVFLSHKEFWWMGYDRSKRARLNNWTPWITSQLITVFLLTEKNAERQRAGLAKCMEIQDEYMKDVPLDGGIDEGVTYWGVAGGKMLESVNLLYAASCGALDLTGDEQLMNITDFVRKCYVGNGYCVNFNDASPLAGADANMLYTFAKTNRAEKLAAFAYEMAKIGGLLSGARNLSIFFNGLQGAAELRRGTPPCDWMSMDAFLPGIQVVIAREKEDGTGLFLAVKGNHNGESHNHNDVGNYVVYKNSVPVIIDLGQGTYVKKTFSEQRYEIPNCRSLWHNLPVINGAEQLAGLERSVKNFIYEALWNSVSVIMDIAGAYEEKSGALTAERNFLFERGKKAFLAVRGSFVFEGENNTVDETLILTGNVKCGSGRVTVENGGEKTVITPEFPCEIGQPEEYTDDEQIISRWGSKIYRVRLTFRGGREMQTGYTVK